ncbi:sorbosone dehydrogenase family protein [Neptunomonas sp.]|uniref:PQQ-dependent sugar dehydrogenase n=1 Tax=Neptunomonas sp. TaxID=1971898 RepID=UPI00356AE95E
MPIKRLRFIVFTIVTASTLGAFSSAVSAINLISQPVRLAGNTYTVNVPSGYVFEVLTTEVDLPRMLTFHPDGSLFAGSRSGRVYRLPAPYQHPQELQTRFIYPHSVAFRDDRIFVASTEGLYSGQYSPSEPLLIQDLEKVMPLPVGGHSSRTVKVGPDKRVYVSLGISGNCSDEYLGQGYSANNRRGGVMLLDEPVASGWQVYSSGLRNPVGFDWSPHDGDIYASNNGPDHSGYEQPAEQFAHLQPGSFHGMPWYQYDGEQVMRDDCQSGTPPRSIDEVQKPVATFAARSAPMAVAFVPVNSSLTEFSGNALVALHGSWATQRGGGRASRRHPKLVMVQFDQGKAVGVEDLLTGFQLDNGNRWARPVGIAIGPDNAIYISSDGEPSAIFRLRRQ